MALRPRCGVRFNHLRLFASAGESTESTTSTQGSVLGGVPQHPADAVFKKGSQNPLPLALHYLEGKWDFVSRLVYMG